MRLLRLTLTLALLVLSVTAWGMTPTTNFDFEEGFTNGVANGWESYSYDGSPVTCTESATAHSGVKAQKVETVGEGGVKAKFTTVPGVAYRVTVWCKRDSGVPFVAVSAAAEENVLNLPGEAWQQLNAETTEWQSASAEVTPTGDGITMFLDMWGGSCHWDHVTLEELNTLPASPYYRIYGQGSELVGGGNIYFTGGVFNGQCYTGHLAQCGQVWGDEQVQVPVWTYDYWDGAAWVPALTTSEPSARVKMTQPWMPVGVYGPENWGRPVSKCTIPVGNRIYMAGGGTELFQTTGWWNGIYQPAITVVETPSGEIVDCIATDGQNIFATIYLYPWTRVNTLYKYAVDPATGAVSNAPGWPKAISGVGALSSVSYYQGKLYAVDSNAPYGIFEIDPDTGAATKLADFIYPANGADTQVVRYGNQMFIVCAALNCHRLYTYTLNAGVWSATSSYLVSRNNDGLDPLDTYGVAVKGDGTTATHAWVTSQGAVMQFFGLIDPWASGPTEFGTTPLKNGHRIHANNAVVTVVGTDGFWIENTDRTVSAHVLYEWPMSDILGHYVTIKGTVGRSDSSERTVAVVSADDVVFGALADPAVKPVYMTNKSMGLATGGMGLANDGLLVTISGKTKYDYDPLTFEESLIVDDGSGVPSGVVDVTGVRVRKADGTALSDVPGFSNLVAVGVPCYAKVTGVVRLVKLEDGTVVRRLDARSIDDIVITAL